MNWISQEKKKSIVQTMNANAINSFTKFYKLHHFILLEYSCDKENFSLAKASLPILKKIKLIKYKQAAKDAMLQQTSGRWSHRIWGKLICISYLK